MTQASCTPAVKPRVDSATAILAQGQLRYSTVWEDHLLLEQGLAAMEGTDLLVITSAGDQVLNLLLHGPRRIVAIDINPAQSALLDLKLAAIATLDHASFIDLLGLTPASADARIQNYARARRRLSAAGRRWWDDNTTLIAAGISDAGRLERYIAGFRSTYLSGAHERALVDSLLSASGLDQQRAMTSELFTAELCQAFVAYFNAANLGAQGRDPAQMQYVGSHTDVGLIFRDRLLRACTDLPLVGNFYVERFLRGGLRHVDRGPPYLHRTNFSRLRTLAARVSIETVGLQEYLSNAGDASLDHAALSDAFEYCSESETARLMQQLTRVLRPGSRIAYWNLLVPRSGSDANPRLRWLRDLSRALSARDRAWFYQAFRVEEVLP